MKKILATLLIVITIAVQAQWYDFIGQLQFDPASPNPAHSEGMAFYDNTTKALAYYTDIADVHIDAGHMNVVRARNVTGVAMTKGQVVYVSGTTGQTPQITPASSAFFETSFIIGVVAADIPNSSFGIVVTQGNIENVDTSAFVDGAILYLDDNGGMLVNTPPQPPSLVQQVAIVLNSHASQGKLLIKQQLLPRIEVPYRNFTANSSGDSQFNPTLQQFTSGNNVAFDGGGSITGTFANDTTAADQLDGTRVFKYSTVTVNDWISFKEIVLPNVITKSDMTLHYSLRYAYDGLDSDIELRVKCITDSSFILDDTNGQPQIPISSNKLIGSIVVPKDCLSIKFGFQVMATNAPAEFFFDEFVINDDNKVANVYIEEKWVNGGAINITSVNTDPTKGTVQIDSVKYRRVGSHLEVLYSYRQNVAGIAGTGVYLFELPNGLQMDLSVVSGTNSGSTATTRTGGDVLGHGHVEAGTNGYIGAVNVIAHDATHVKLYTTAVTDDAGTTAYVWANDVVSAAAFALNGNNVTYKFKISVPIQGWSAYSEHVVVSDSTSAQDIVVEGAGNGATSITANVTNIDFTETVDTNSAFNGTQFTVPESGIYSFTGTVRITPSSSAFLYMYINGTQNRLIYADAGYDYKSFSETLKLDMGAVVSFRLDQTTTLVNSTLHRISITKAAAITKADIVALFPEATGSFIKFSEANGFGSTATGIRRYNFSSCSQSGFGAVTASKTCGDVTCTDSVTEGTQCTILRDGFYSLGVYDETLSSGTFSAEMGVTLNATPAEKSGTGPHNLTDRYRILALTTQKDLGAYDNAAWSGLLKAGDVITPHMDDSALTSNTSRAAFWIGRPDTSYNNSQSAATRKTGYLAVAANYTVNTPATTSAKSRTITALSGDTSFISSHSGAQVFLDAGEYEVAVPVGGEGGTGWVSLIIRQDTDGIDDTYGNVAYGFTGSNIAFNTVHTTIVVPVSGKAYVFRTLSQSATGFEYISRIKITKVK